MKSRALNEKEKVGGEGVGPSIIGFLLEYSSFLFILSSDYNKRELEPNICAIGVKKPPLLATRRTPHKMFFGRLERFFIVFKIFFCFCESELNIRGKLIVNFALVFLYTKNYSGRIFNLVFLPAENSNHLFSQKS